MSYCLVATHELIAVASFAAEAKYDNDNPVCETAKENNLLDSGRGRGWDDLGEWH